MFDQIAWHGPGCRRHWQLLGYLAPLERSKSAEGNPERYTGRPWKKTKKTWLVVKFNIVGKYDDLQVFLSGISLFTVHKYSAWELYNYLVGGFNHLENESQWEG